ncbi:MAG TPA: oligosaccharide flippase family protein [Blastocatellia bacterium]|nr:oligosaccharide flippase family protein [Blastocatellia bacterium]
MRITRPSPGGARFNSPGQAKRSPGDDAAWDDKDRQLSLIARNVSMDYAVVFVELVIGLVMLPFNTAHLGQSAYGLWVLTASITIYFSMLDLGYGAAMVKFAAQYRAHRDATALNQVVSTIFFIFSAIGLAAYALAVLLALNLESLFNVTPEQAATGQQVLLIISVYIALGFPFSVFGGIVNGFQRKYLNGTVAITTSIVVALVNAAVLLAGYGLVELVAATTTVRILSYFAYRLNAYRVFPALSVRAKHFRLSRLREVTGFSAFMLLIDLANKLNYSTDTIVIGAFMTTAAVAIWAVAARLIDLTQRLTDQLNGALFPVIVDSATLGQSERLRKVFLQGTRLSLAMVIPIACGLALMAGPLVHLWVGPAFAGSVPIIHILAAVVIYRVGNATATTLLKGAGHHRLLAFSNLAIGVMNLVLSLALVGRYGLVGVAIGTLIPLAAVSMFVLFPAACRRTQVSIGHALREAVWPALWPAMLMAAFLLISRELSGTGLAWIAVEAIAAGILYVAVFLGLAIRREERHWYLNKSRQLFRRPGIAAAV